MTDPAPPSATPPGLRSRGLRQLLMASCAVVIIAGLKAAGELILPILVALFLALLCMPPIRRMRRHNIPNWAAIAIMVAVMTLALVFVTGVIGGSLQTFESELPTYRERLDAILGDALAFLADRGVHLDADQLTGEADSAAIVDLTKNVAAGLLAALSNLFLVILTMVFMLFEASGFERKLRRAIGDPDADLGKFYGAAETVSKYLAIKAKLSLANGVSAGLLCWAAGVDFPILWALIAFLFNFVPNIGAVIAAVPPVLLALVLDGVGVAIIVALGYVAFNLVFDNIMEPRMMGRRLGLSTLVVFLSLLFWNWVWGPVGMLLSVPLTVVVKIVFEQSHEFRWIAVLLGPIDDPEPPSSREADTVGDS